MLANISFIGELFKVQMLTSNIMHYCITTLFDEKNEPDEEKVELLCKLFQSIGEKLDTPVRLRVVSTPPLLSPIAIRWAVIRLHTCGAPSFVGLF